MSFRLEFAYLRVRDILSMFMCIGFVENGNYSRGERVIIALWFNISIREADDEFFRDWNNQ